MGKSEEMGHFLGSEDNAFSVCSQAVEAVAQRGVGVLIVGATENLSGRGPGHPAGADAVV